MTSFSVLKQVVCKITAMIESVNNAIHVQLSVCVFTSIYEDKVLYSVDANNLTNFELRKVLPGMRTFRNSHYSAIVSCA
jgi:hypothetical protein